MLGRLTRALKPRGVAYLSFNWVEGERWVDERHFLDQTEDSFAALLLLHPDLAPLRVWVTGYVRPGRSEERWLSALIQRRHNG